MTQLIPTDTIARIFQVCSFTQDTTLITEDTVKITQKYIDLFIREAVLRSMENKEQIKKEEHESSFTDNVILTHTDLEDISGLLLLDL